MSAAASGEASSLERTLQLILTQQPRDATQATRNVRARVDGARVVDTIASDAPNDT